ncbi:MAG: hypothetical protein QOF87_2835 [Pseudonocardiales bacterium]|jgi:hypothetical protein|nr:hypothetical protein [Pseudonocardiales bacterium]MDT4908601.1 hypothetical protein [Pseudonocardiales bacterium]MDT4959946.1 hypothetical protein [Pseudonocardiales bacterium]MDT4963188.1 hypothetical protein [Pseudonocardiales bacterium]MDT4975498.1 hypothetical protein [Pseudonocardiales bacterium]
MPKVPPSNGPSRPGSARERSAAFRAAQRRAERRRRVLMWVAAVVVVAAAAAGITTAVRSKSSNASAQTPSDVATSVLTGPAGPEGIVLEQGQLLAPASTAATGQTIDGIQCNSAEQVAYHIHSHLTVYVNGVLRPIPAGIGVVTPVAQQTANGVFDSASQCYYWLHVHAQDGVIHVESPNQTNYTLGQFFAIWKQPLTASQIGPATGTLTVFVNGTRYTGNPADIVLKSHEDIQIDVGTPAVAAQKIDWSNSQL